MSISLRDLPMDPPDDRDWAPNWDQGQVLTWSGKWHIIYAALDTGPDRQTGYARALCGVSGYRRDHVPRYVARLQSITCGRVKAPVCKKCEKSAAAQAAEAPETEATEEKS